MGVTVPRGSGGGALDSVQRITVQGYSPLAHTVMCCSANRSGAGECATHHGMGLESVQHITVWHLRLLAPIGKTK